MTVFHWVAAPSEAGEAVLTIDRADNQLLVLVDGNEKWNSEWTSGNPEINQSIRIPIPEIGYTEVVTLGANGGVNDRDPYSFVTRLTVPGRAAISGGRSGPMSAPGIIFSETFRVYRLLPKLPNNDRYPRFLQEKQDKDLTNCVCPAFVTEPRGSRYICQAALCVPVDQRLPFDINFLIKQLSGELVDFTYKFYELGDRKGAQGNVRLEFDGLRFEKKDTARQVNLRFKNIGPTLDRNQVFAELDFHVSNI